MPVYSRKVKNKKLPDGSYSNKEGTVYDVYFRYQDGDTRQNYAKRGFLDRKEAQEHEAEMRIKLSKPTFSLSAAQKGKMPLSEYLLEWLVTYAKHNVRPNTYRGYEINIRKHVIPNIGTVPLNTVTAQMLDNMYRKLLENGLSIASVKYVHRTLSIALKHALSYQYIESNPTKNTITKFAADSKTPEPYTIDEMRRLIRGVGDNQWEFIIMLGGLYGLRRNEVLGLTMENIDINHNEFKIVEQLASAESKKVTGKELVDVKEKSSVRALPITKYARPFFERQLERLTYTLQNFDPKTYKGFVICDAEGQPLKESHISEHFKTITNKIGMRYIRFHDLRHSAATNMHQLTGDFYTVGEILGHSLKGIGNQLGVGNLEATTERYVDVRMERKRIVLDAYHTEIQKKKSKDLER
jgi:integrase